MSSCCWKTRRVGPFEFPSKNNIKEARLSFRTLPVRSAAKSSSAQELLCWARPRRRPDRHGQSLVSPAYQSTRSRARHVQSWPQWSTRAVRSKCFLLEGRRDLTRTVIARSCHRLVRPAVGMERWQKEKEKSQVCESSRTAGFGESASVYETVRSDLTRPPQPEPFAGPSDLTRGRGRDSGRKKRVRFASPIAREYSVSSSARLVRSCLLIESIQPYWIDSDAFI